ncbi:DDE-type integrase/transposase/recombinase [Glutamicibacter ardleyensis]|uniref:DDE-type integrase/transposase/recombinase n=1 Tax=Glutamicibacter ardleyensis TaxID=225894 RepID=UPI003FD45379
MWQEKTNFAIEWMCRRLGVSRASYYRWTTPVELTPTASRHAELSVKVAMKFADSAQIAGRDQLTKLLNRRGVKVAAGTAGSIMNESGLRVRRMRARKRTTVIGPGARTEHIKNHMLDEHGKRDFTAVVAGTRLVGDITYLKTVSGWLYLATVNDLATRMVIGWSMDSNMRTPMIIHALGMARDHGRLHSNGAILHSDYAEVFVKPRKPGPRWSIAG